VNISILTLFPSLYDTFLQTSLVGRAQESHAVTFTRHNLLSFCKPKERIDGPVYGHGPGMVLRPDIMQQAIENAQQQQPAYRIFFSPHGKKLTQSVLQDIYKKVLLTNHVMLIAGRYEGMDARIEQEYADEIISLGDFVLMGGDLPALCFLEGFLRLIPGVVGCSESVERDSFTGPFVDYPAYTQPVVWKNREVPQVLRSGNHKTMQEWRNQEAAARSVVFHFDWVRSYPRITDQEKQLVREHIPHHYVALMHTQVMLPHDMEGTTSVTSLDIHDIARSAKTYGFTEYGIVTPLIDQQKIVKTLLNFWQTGSGVTYNEHRHEAVSQVNIYESLEKFVEQITHKEGVRPIIIATSAKTYDKVKTLTYHDQATVWSQNRPVLIILGTGRGLSSACIEQSDYVLIPLESFGIFNHLSVRSAAAIIFDRWLGRNIEG
jgi:tRNA (guanine37-N1)-methyltransferase